MAKHTKSIEIDAPVHEVFEQWRNYEQFERFLPQLADVHKTGERTSHWTLNVAGMTVEWDAEVTALEQDRLIAWRSIRGLETSGEARFKDLGAGRTCVDLTLEYTPPLGASEGLFGVGAKVDEKLEEGLENVKETVEAAA
jgi:uncharacterized membrane protein